MISSFRNFLNTWRKHKEFAKSSEDWRRLVIYSEGQQDWPHIGPMVQEFLEMNPSEKVSYLSSEERDPGLNFKHDRYKSFYIGDGMTRTVFFRTLRAKLLLMTLTDLNVFFLKRSAAYPVHYVYCFHSINSTHTVYREQAFQFYDTLLCVGPHHVRELRKEEELKNLKPRKLLEHGSIKLDTVLDDYKDFRDHLPDSSSPLILLAPSWGAGSFAENPDLIRSIIRKIVENNWCCRLRLHPMTVRRFPDLIKTLEADFSIYVQKDLFKVEDNLNDNSSLRDAAVMVSDWSGAATEFAFGLERPVLFINTPQKINNPNWEAFGFPGLEDTVRKEIGVVVDPSEIDTITDQLKILVQNAGSYKEKIQKSREANIFNVGRSCSVGAKNLSELLTSVKEQTD